MNNRIAFSADDPVSLAGWLLEEIARSMIPVWPSTPRYAARMVEGLSLLHATRPDDVMRALERTPDVAIIDWKTLLEPIVDLDRQRRDLSLA